MEMNTQQVARLERLAIAVAAFDKYNHCTFFNPETGEMCALGLAVSLKETVFPGLQLELKVSQLTDRMNIENADEVADKYFGEGAWYHIFSGFAKAPAGHWIETREDAVVAINNHIARARGFA